MKKILLADDNEVVRDVLKFMFEKRGFEVTLAEDGMGAITAAENEMPDLIVLDMNMPVMTGWSATRKLKKDGASTAAIPIIALTAHKTAEDHAEAHEAGCDAFVQKPIMHERLFEIVDRVLGQKNSDPSTEPSLGGQ